MRTLVLVGDSLRIALQVLQAAHSSGYENCVLAGSAGTLGLRWSRLCRKHVVLDFADDQKSLHLINGLAEKLPECVLIPFDCAGIRLVNRVRDGLRPPIIPIPDLNTVDMFDDKWRFYEFCLASSLPAPPTIFIGEKSALDFDAIVGELGLPFVIKPTNCSGSLGVQIVRSRNDLEKQIMANAQYEFAHLIAQRYIEGVDMCINLMSVHGRLYTFSAERRGKSWIEFVPHAPLEEIAEKICRASGFNGVMNLDVRMEVDTGKVYLIESNPRFWATLASTVGCGLNFLTESLKEFSLEAGPSRLASGRYYTRHPLLRPTSWRQLASDRGEPGRLLRARMFDLYSIFQLARESPSMAVRFARRGTVSACKGARDIFLSRLSHARSRRRALP